MNAEELVRIMDTWSDALNVAEVVGSPFLRVTESWDLHDWQAVDLPDGVKFQHLGAAGDVTEEIVIVGEAPQKEVRRPAESDAVRTWRLLVRTGDRSRKVGAL